MTRKIQRLFVANRSEIACRIMQTAAELGIETVAAYSEPDREAEHVVRADSAVALGGSSPAESYLDIDKIVAAALGAGADAIHPGYGFLAENAGFARAVAKAGMIFVGPSPEAIERMGDKLSARRAAEACSVPLIPSAEIVDDQAANRSAAEKLGLPVLVKAAAGGGGRGMRRVDDAGGLAAAIEAASREAASAFGDGRVYLEKYVLDPRHIEIQVFGDGRGQAIHLGERECSIQRRHQKIVEECPSPVVDPDLRERLGAAAVALTKSIEYAGAGTVEFVLAPDGAFYFLEMNTRLQVEHAVTEAVTSTDLVRWQLEIAGGGGLPERAPQPRGHAIECRVYAEDPAKGFLPTAGHVHRVDHPRGVGVRVDSALRDDYEVPVQYDSMLAKVTAWGADRDQATRRVIRALEDFAIIGVTTNIPFLLELLESPRFREAGFTTGTIDEEYRTWSENHDAALDVSAAAAALMISKGLGLSAGTAAAAVTAKGPWETLGAWRAAAVRRG